jgi:hypothetical protein
MVARLMVARLMVARLMVARLIVARTIVYAGSRSGPAKMKRLSCSWSVMRLHFGGPEERGFIAMERLVATKWNEQRRWRKDWGEDMRAEWVWRT